METIILNQNGEKVRPLTKAETRLLHKYDLSLKAKVFLSQVWALKPKPVVQKSQFKVKIAGLLAQIVAILLPIVLLLQFFDPQGLLLKPYLGEYTQAVLLALRRSGFFLVGCLIVISLLTLLANGGIIHRLNSNGEKDWSPGTLSCIIEKSWIRKNFFFTLSAVTFISFIITNHYVVGVVYLIVVILFHMSNKNLKKEIQKALDNKTVEC